MMKQNIFDGLDPEIIDRVASRRDALRGFGKWGAGLAFASVPLAFAGMAKSAFAQQGLPQEVVNVLNYALTLEYLEAEYYNSVLTAASGLIPAAAMPIFTKISDHENAHVALLQSALGPQAIEKPHFDFTAGGAFQPYQDYPTFVTLAQGFEDTGVRAYKGQAPKLLGTGDLLTTALQIHSVEARHASVIRRLAESPAEEGWIPFDTTSVPALEPIYAGMAETVKYDVDVVAVSGIAAEGVTEAFDEPLTMQEVLQIVDQFIDGDVDGDGMPG